MPRAASIVPVRPEVLVWARESIGLSQADAAASLKVPLETLQAWERGEGFGITQLRRIAATYKKPVSALFQPTVPPIQRVPPDYRTVEGIAPAFSVETMQAIRDAQRIQAIATELTASEPALFEEGELPHFDPTRDNPQETGLIERGSFGVGIADQLAWSSANHAYNVWRARLQLAGVLTLVKSMPRSDCRGFSLYEAGMVPVVVVNSQEADQAKIFTLFHEYGHLAAHREGICLERDQVDLERWCNQFSASLLVPSDALRSAAPTGVSTTARVQEIAWRFNVSRHVIALRLSEGGLAPADMYDHIKDEDARRQDWDKPHISEEEDFKGRPQEAVCLSELGFGFARIIISALEYGLINAVDASDFLDVRPEKLAAVAQRAERAVTRYR